MYQSFSVVTIEPVIAKKQIIVTTNADINVNILKDAEIELFERITKSHVAFDLNVNGKVLIITFKDWPIPNSEYILMIKGLQSVADEELDNSVKKRIVFKSNIISKAEIISPSMFEEVEDFKVLIKETADCEDDLKNAFYIEVAKDNTFYDVVIKTFIKKDIVKLSLQKTGQYYIRVRVQETENSEEYGLWSNTITFKYNNGSEPNIDEEDNEDQNNGQGPDIDIEDFELLTELDQGTTPKSLVLEFSKDVDNLSLSNIVIIRKVVK